MKQVINTVSVNKIEIMSEAEIAEHFMRSYPGWGELVSSYLEEERSEPLFCITSINETEEIWNQQEIAFSEEFSTCSASIDNLLIGYIGFGSCSLSINDVLIEFKCVVEQNASPIGVHITKDTRNKIISALGNNLILELGNKVISSLGNNLKTA